MDESYISRIAGSLKIEFDWKNVATKTGIVVLGSLSGQYPLGAGIIGGLAASINIGSEMSLKPKGLPECLADYAYLYYAHKDIR